MDDLLDAVAANIVATLGYAATTECNVTPDGKPDPGAGQRFVSVHPGNMSNGSKHALDGYFGFKVTLTLRTGMTPRDRKKDAGIWTPADAIIVCTHMSYVVTNGANAAAQAAGRTVNFVEPPQFESGNYLGAKGPDWFWAEGQEPDPTGIAVELTFGRARWVRYIDET